MDWDEVGPLCDIPIDPGEILSHYLFRKELRPDGSVRADAVVPFPNEALSATRHRGITEAEVWESGKTVASKMGRTLFGRADFKRSDLPPQLDVIPSEPPRNHADIVGWPSDLSSQLARAIEMSGICTGYRLSS